MYLIATKMSCFQCKLNHRVFSFVDYIANNERGVGLFGTIRSNSEALTAKPANEQLLHDALCVVFLFACMYVCVFEFGYHYALLYQGFSVGQVIFLEIS